MAWSLRPGAVVAAGRLALELRHAGDVCSAVDGGDATCGPPGTYELVLAVGRHEVQCGVSFGSMSNGSSRRPSRSPGRAFVPSGNEQH